MYFYNYFFEGKPGRAMNKIIFLETARQCPLDEERLKVIKVYFNEIGVAF